MKYVKNISAALAFAFILLLPSAQAPAVDEEACLGCHKYFGLRTEDASGAPHDFHVNEEAFGRSIHSVLTCRGCHVEISRIPHGKREGKVNCGVSCHIYLEKDEGTSSHAELYNKHLETAHGKAVDKGPDCLYCHSQNEPKDRAGDRHAAADELCAGCHAQGRPGPRENGAGPGVVDDVYHMISIAKNYRDAPGCIDCHPAHAIYRRTDARSSIGADSIGSTCGGAYASGKGCHEVLSGPLLSTRIHDSDLANRRGRSERASGPWVIAMLLMAPLALRMFFNSIHQ